MNNNLNKKNDENKLIESVQIINLCIGIIIALMVVLIYTTIKSIYIKLTIITIVIILGIMGFITLMKKFHTEEPIIDDESNISTIALINKENEIIKLWDITEEVSVIIGKNTTNSDVDIDLNSSIYSTLIEDEHAVLNYAAGTWYVEDLSSENGVSIQKIDDGEKYRIINHSPCKIKKGDILFIAKTKLLLR